MFKRIGQYSLLSITVLALFSGSLETKSSRKNIYAQVALKKVQQAEKIVAWDIHKVLCTKQKNITGDKCTPKEDVFNLVKTLNKNGIKQVILSNISRKGYCRLACKYPSYFKYFNQSGSLADAQGLRFRKPRTKYYKYFLRKNNDIQPKNIIFFDDKSENIKKARKNSIDAHLFCNAAETERVLKQKCLL